MSPIIYEILKLTFIGFELSKIFYPNQQVFSAQILPEHLQTLMKSNCSNIEEKFFPLVKVQHSDEVYNSSFELIESSDVVNEHSGFLFSITCVAYYPIEWVVNYFYNGYPNGNFGLHLQVHRKVGNFRDPSTYKFTISSKLRYKNNHGFKNFSFSCQSVDRPTCLHTILFTSFDEKHDGKNGVKVNVVSGPSWENESISEFVSPQDAKGNHSFPKSSSSSYSIDRIDDSNSPCDFKVYENNLGLNRYALSCEFDNGTPGIVKIIHQCSNAISCMTFHQQHHQPLLPQKCAVPQGLGNSVTCPTCQKRTVPLSQGFLACVAADDKDSHHHHNYGKLLFFFSSVPQERHNHSSKLYFNMEQVEPSEMLSLAKINKKVSLGDSIHVVCNSSSYYFASGTKFGVKYKGSEEITYIKGIANPSNGPGAEYSPANIYEGNIPITTSFGSIERIYCFAPTWNSFLWINKSIDVKDAVIPEGKGSPHIVTVVSVTLLLTSLFCCLLFGLCWMKILRRKLSKFGKLLTPQEVDEFRSRPTTATIFENGKNHNDNDYVNTALMSNNRNSGDIFYLEIRREQLLLDETVLLGKGHFGKVIKGVYKDEKNEKMDVAIKTLLTKSDVGALKSLLSELKIMASVGKNLNVVNLIGACTKRMQKGEVFVAVEYCGRGNLQNYLRTHRDRFQNQLQRDILIVETPYSVRKSVDDESILSLDLIKWAWEIGRGMEFLASKKVCHGDLALRNVLLTFDKVAKISDFGLSRQLVDYYYVKEESDVAMPWKWMSIESLRDMKFSIQSDVWSMGILLWELFTLAEIPYYGCSWSLDFVAALDAGHRLGRPQYASSEMYELMLGTWKVDPSDRPTFTSIKTFFEDIITQCTYQDYMQLDLCGTGSSHHHHNRDDHTMSISRTPLLTPTIEIVSDCEVEDDVFEQ